MRELKRQHEVAQFLEKLTGDERIQLEREAVRSAPALQRSLIEQRGSLSDAARKLALKNYVTRLLGTTS